MAMTRVSFVGGPTGEWQIERIVAVKGDAIPEARALDRIEGADFAARPGARWTLNGVRSSERYVERAEKDRLAAVQQGLGRPDSRLGALIPITKSQAW